MGIVVPMYPARRAIEELTRFGRLDLRQHAVRVVVSEIQAGRDGMSVMRQIASARRLRKQQGGSA